MVFDKLTASSSPSSNTETKDDASDAAGPAGGKRETLAARAQRIIGKALETESSVTPDNARRGPPKKAPTKRREQVLQAQRTHRQRTQGYIRELEKEVLRLREREQELVSEKQKFNNQIELLKQVLLSNNLSLPSGFDPVGNVQITNDLGKVSIFTSQAPVTVDLTELSRIEAEKWCGIAAAEEVPPPYVEPTSNALRPFRTLSPPSGVPASSDLESCIITMTLNAQSAVDFVLELERPCLPHLKFRYMTGYQVPSFATTVPASNAGPGHVFTATATLMNEHWEERPPDRPFAVSPDEIDKLFQTSLSLELGPDCTPIQIWANLTRISARYPISDQLLRVLTDEFMKYIRCNSFGAVVERATASAIISHFFPGEEFISDWPLP